MRRNHCGKHRAATEKIKEKNYCFGGKNIVCGNGWFSAHAQETKLSQLEIVTSSRDGGRHRLLSSKKNWILKEIEKFQQNHLEKLATPTTNQSKHYLRPFNSSDRKTSSHQINTRLSLTHFNHSEYKEPALPHKNTELEFKAYQG
ncbi:hypothetical protein NPIL_495951 [Nephila pilipes]|uniref:Uncharacterized protein n=1 Tax=Nephila pilipes TaxID=299642 RepID=A0A8X6PPP1_NEPPI|nr:hypothetical protein NPIL_495951 [Nephila pilipes]